MRGIIKKECSITVTSLTNKDMFKMTPLRFGPGLCALVGTGVGLMYIFVLREPGSTFYAFAALAFLGSPLIAGIVAALRTQGRKQKAFFAAISAVFGIVFVLFVFTYVVLPQFARTNVRLPEFCDGLDGSFTPPSQLSYTLPDIGTGILITSDADIAVVATIDDNYPPYPSTVHLVNKNDNKILRSMHFSNDVISAGVDQDTVYIFNDKLGYLIDKHTGSPEENFLLIDNYGGLTETDRPIVSRASDGHWYMETTAVISSWGVGGTVKSRPHLTFNDIARGCFISGDTGDVTQL